jgi:hypothetical protein
MIFLLLPKSSIHRGSFLTWSTARLKWLVLLSGENTSVYITYATPPYSNISTDAGRWSFGIQTVNIAPRIIMPKLNVCCVVLAAFSLAERSLHATLPSSFNIVTAFLFLVGCALVVPRPVWVAYRRAARIGRRPLGSFSNGETRGIGNILEDCWVGAQGNSDSSLNEHGSQVKSRCGEMTKRRPGGFRLQPPRDF